MARLPDIVPITDLRQDAASVLGKVQNSSGPLVITQRGRATAVMLSIEAYEKAEEEREILRMLIKADKEVAQGQGDTFDDVMAEVNKMIQGRLEQ